VRLRVVPKDESVPQKRFVRVAPYVFLNTETGVYYVRKSFHRHRIPELFETTRETKLGRAKAKADELIQAHLDHYLSGKTGLASKRAGTPIAEVIDEVLRVVTPGKRRRTQENHRLYLNELKREWGSWDVNRIKLEAWNSWLAEFRTRKNRTTYVDYAKNMNLVLRYAYKQRLATHLVTIPNPDPKANAGRLFTADEIGRLWEAMNEDTRDQFVLSFECLMRLREGLYLTWDRVDLELGVITLGIDDVKTGTKTGKGRSFRMSDRALARMKARRLRVPGPLVFPSPTNPAKPMHQNKTAWQLAKKKAGIKGRARWHDLRHTALTVALLDAKMDPLLVSEYAGVSVRTIQAVYLHATHDKTAAVAGAVRIKP
jgi:integrase